MHGSVRIGRQDVFAMLFGFSRAWGRREVGVEERIMGSKLYWFQYWLYEGSKSVNLGKSARYIGMYGNKATMRWKS